MYSVKHSRQEFRELQRQDDEQTNMQACKYCKYRLEA